MALASYAYFSVLIFYQVLDLGSIVSSASINVNRNKELRSIIDLNKEGKWLVLLENQIGTELPWALIKQSDPRDIIFIES